MDQRLNEDRIQLEDRFGIVQFRVAARRYRTSKENLDISTS